MKNVKQNKKNLSYLTLKYMQNVELMMNSSRSFHNVKSSVHAPNSVPSYTLSICVYFNEIIFCHCRMAFNVSPALPQYHSNCSLPSRPLRSAHSFNSCHQELRMERSLVFMMILLYSWVHIYSNAYFCYKLMLLYPHMVYRAHTLKTNCNRDAICAETSCHSPPAASEAHLNVRGLCCLKKNKTPIQLDLNVDQWTWPLTGAQERGAAPVWNTQLQGQISRLSPFFSSPVWSPSEGVGKNRKSDEGAREIFGIKETVGTEKRGDFDLRLSSCR